MNNVSLIQRWEWFREEPWNYFVDWFFNDTTLGCFLMNNYFRFVKQHWFTPLSKIEKGHFYYNFYIDDGSKNNWFVLRHIFPREEHLESVNMVYICSKETTVLDLVVAMGHFPSKSQARNAHWDKPLEEGVNRFDIGNKYHTFWVYKK